MISPVTTAWRRNLLRLMSRSEKLSPTGDMRSPETNFPALEPLLDRPDVDSLAFQSMAVQALQSVARARRAEAHVAQSALSLAQQTVLREMVATLDAAHHALRTLVQSQGAQVLAFAEPDTPAAAESTWWGRLDYAIGTLSDEAQRLTSLASGQPCDGAIRILSRILSTLFREHAAYLQQERAHQAA